MTVTQKWHERDTLTSYMEIDTQLRHDMKNYTSTSDLKNDMSTSDMKNDTITSDMIKGMITSGMGSFMRNIATFLCFHLNKNIITQNSDNKSALRNTDTIIENNETSAKISVN